MSSVNNNTPPNLNAPGAAAPTPEPAQANAPGVNKAAKAARNEAVGAALLEADPTVNSGVTTEKKRTGFAALANPPPLPPSNGHARPTGQSMQAFNAMHSDIDQALASAQPTNQPKLSELNRQFEAADTSTPAGRQQAAAAQGQMTQTVTRSLNLPTSTGSLGAFLLLVVSSTDKQKNAQVLLQDLTNRSQQSLAVQHLAEVNEQNKAQDKANKKAAQFAFLKPLMTILTVIFAALACLTPLGLALTAIGAVVGFVAGGIKGGKDKGGGFDIKAALSGALMGGSIGGGLASIMAKLPALLMSAFTQAAKLAARTGDNVVGRAGTRQLELIQAANDARATGTAVARNQQSGLWQRFETAVKDGQKKWNGDEGKISRAQNIATSAVPTVGDLAQAGVNYKVQTLESQGAKHEAQAKMIKVLEEAMMAQGERNQDAVQGLVDTRKNSMNRVNQLIGSHFQTALKAIDGIKS